MLKLAATVSTLAVVALLAVGCGENSAGTTTTASAGSSSTASTASSSASTQATSASGDTGALTVGATEGPYYVSGTAELVDGELNYTNLPGEPIKISGYVYGGVGDSTPLAGARVDIWHADSAGSYHPNSNGPATDYSPDQLALRGYVLTDAGGYYEFTSIYPGQYPGRCRHIHIIASAEGYGAIVTQLIVPSLAGDTTTPETDQIAQSLPAVNDLQFITENGVQAATFNFHLGGD